MKSLQNLLILIYLAFSASAQEYSINDFRVLPIAELDDSTKHNLLSYKESIIVLKDSGKIKFRKYIHSISKQFKIPYGELITIDRGEFSGGLFYKPNNGDFDSVFVNGTYKPFIDSSDNILFMKSANPLRKILTGSVELINDNFRDIFEFNGEIYILHGLEHLSTSEGGLYRLKYQHSNFKLEKVIDFNESPLAFKLYSDHIIVVFNSKISRISKAFSVETIFSNTLWHNLYPTSIEKVGRNQIYVGVTGGFVKLNLKNKSQLFYIIK